MNTNESIMSYDVPYAFYFYWNESDFKYWKNKGCIPTELLDLSRVRDLHKFIYDNRGTLFKALAKRA